MRCTKCDGTMITDFPICKSCLAPALYQNKTGAWGIWLPRISAMSHKKALAELLLRYFPEEDPEQVRLGLNQGDRLLLYGVDHATALLFVERLKKISVSARAIKRNPLGLSQAFFSPLPMMILLGGSFGMVMLRRVAFLPLPLFFAIGVAIFQWQAARKPLVALPSLPQKYALWSEEIAQLGQLLPELPLEIGKNLLAAVEQTIEAIEHAQTSRAWAFNAPEIEASAREVIQEIFYIGKRIAQTSEDGAKEMMTQIFKLGEITTNMVQEIKALESPQKHASDALSRFSEQIQATKAIVAEIDQKH